MKIATLTLNPALDRTMYCFGVTPGALNRAVAPSVTTVGGKGTNVSCVFKIFGIESTAYGFIGGNNGDLFLRLLEPYNIKTDFTRTKCETRMNIKIISSGGEPTEFNESGGPVESFEKEDILKKIKSVMDDTDLFFMGGSAPLGIEKSIYKNIMELGGDRTKFILDCDGEALRLCISNHKKPYIIKPNQFELEQYCGKNFDLDNNFKLALGGIKEEIKKIYDQTGTTILCTLGGYGGLYCGKYGIFYVPAPKVEVRGFTGAGDTFLAAFIYYTQEGNNAQDSLAFAVAASAAKVTKPGTEFASMSEILSMYEKIK